MTDKQRDEFHTSKECNFAIVRDGIGRFRCSDVLGNETKRVWLSVVL